MKKKIKTMTVRTMVKAEVLPLSASLVSRVVRAHLELAHVVQRTTGCPTYDLEDYLNATGNMNTFCLYSEDAKKMLDVMSLLDDIVSAFEEEDEQEPARPVGTREEGFQPQL